MKLFSNSGNRRKEFSVLHASRSAQAATMTLQPGGTSSDQPEDEHPWAEQWLFILSGTGRARNKKRSLALRPGSLLLIEKREPHQILNTGRRPLVTLNLYVPPAYDSRGEVLKNK
jgi:mannose-6-phosphate isomerase-like protein (cupin superfamily)